MFGWRKRRERRAALLSQEAEHEGFCWAAGILLLMDGREAVIYLEDHIHASACGGIYGDFERGIRDAIEAARGGGML